MSCRRVLLAIGVLLNRKKIGQAGRPILKPIPSRSHANSNNRYKSVRRRRREREMEMDPPRLGMGAYSGPVRPVGDGDGAPRARRCCSGPSASRQRSATTPSSATARTPHPRRLRPPSLPAPVPVLHVHARRHRRRCVGQRRRPRQVPRARRRLGPPYPPGRAGARAGSGLRPCWLRRRAPRSPRAAHRPP